MCLEDWNKVPQSSLLLQSKYSFVGLLPLPELRLASAAQECLNGQQGKPLSQRSLESFCHHSGTYHDSLSQAGWQAGESRY